MKLKIVNIIASVAMISCAVPIAGAAAAEEGGEVWAITKVVEMRPTMSQASSDEQRKQYKSLVAQANDENSDLAQVIVTKLLADHPGLENQNEAVLETFGNRLMWRSTLFLEHAKVELAQAAAASNGFDGRFDIAFNAKLKAVLPWWVVEG
jgi:hypothetical protein